jgi:DNA-directed RNA polymerase specialized sigma24 family protein
VNLCRKRADDLLARDYEALRAKVSAGAGAQLARKNIHFDPVDMEAFYNQAWHGLHSEVAAGRTIANHTGWLVTVTARRALDEYRRLHRDRHADGVEPAEHAADGDLAERLDDAAKLRAFVEGMKDRLSVRECQAATLCYLQGLTRPEAARVLGVEPKRLEKIMDGVSRKVGEFVRAIEAGRWCEARGSLMRAFAFGILDPGGRRYERASEHLGGCTGCRAYVRSLRGLGALLPPVALPRGDAPEAGLLDQLTDWVREAKQALQGLLGGPGPEVAGGGGLAVAGGVGAKLAAGAAAAAIAVGGVSVQAARSDDARVPARAVAAEARGSMARDDATRRGEVVRQVAAVARRRAEARAARRSARKGAEDRRRRANRGSNAGAKPDAGVWTRTRGGVAAGAVGGAGGGEGTDAGGGVQPVGGERPAGGGGTAPPATGEFGFED